MNVLLVSPNSGFEPSMQFTPLGLLCIGSYLKARGYCVRVYDRNVDHGSLKHVLQAFRPDAVGVSVISRRAVNDAMDISGRFRKEKIPVIWGGHMATIAPDLILEENAADYVVMREGEISFHELLQCLQNKTDIAQVEGIAYKDSSGAIHHTPERAFANLADFPVTDWSLVDPRKYFAPHIRCRKMTFLYSSKGCPSRCAFCYNKEYHRCQYRKRPNAYVISEIKELVTKYGMDGVEFADELFGANKRELYDLCGQLRELRLHLAWGFQTRVGLLSREDYEYMYEAGCRWAFFGVESGSPEMLRRIHKDWIDLETIDRDFAYCRELGISTYCAIIIGFPDETQEQLRDTVRLMLRLKADYYPVSMFYPNPGAELYDDLVAQGRVAPLSSLRQKGSFFPTLGLAANYSKVSARELMVIQSFFNWRNFFQKSVSKEKTRYSFAQKTIVTSLKQAWKQGFFMMWRYLISSALLFAKIAWNRYAYPGIRKKYGLYEKRDRQ
ncbi:MAG: B12-binding domain-containing radical SAM protein [Oscillospiraceae bacterium]|nr:B12-binding domain-containing radical SAM protein [Oscillospiraceae bacterium]